MDSINETKDEEVDQSTKISPETHAKIEEILKEHPKLDWLMAYALVTTPIERLREIFKEGKTVDPPPDFLKNAVVTIEKDNEPPSGSAEFNKLFSDL